MLPRAIVGALIRVEGLSASQLERLRSSLSYPNPAYLHQLRRGISAEKIGSMIPRRLSAAIEYPDGSVAIPRGAPHLLHGAVGSRVACDDHRASGSPLDVELKNVALRDYQALGIQEAIKRVQGVIVLPCAGGKTTLGVGIIAAAKVSALIVVHTVDLKDQWCERIYELLGVKAGVIGDGKCDVRDITVGIVNSLRKTDPQKLASFGLCIVDEVHRSASALFQEVLSKIPARRRIGLTATPDREDGLGPLIELTLGPRLIEKTTEQMIAEGWLTPPRIIKLESAAIQFAWQRGDDPNLLTQAIVHSEERNRMIAKLVAKEAADGEFIFVLSNHKEHCDKLAQLIASHGIEAQVVTSKLSKTKRRDALNRMRSGQLHVIIATSLADEGLDIRRLSRLVMALPQRSKNNTVQRIGRLMRPHGEKRPVVYDIVDIGVSQMVVDDYTGRASAINSSPFIRRWAQRRAIYRQMKLEVITHVDASI